MYYILFDGVPMVDQQTKRYAIYDSYELAMFFATEWNYDPEYRVMTSEYQVMHIDDYEEA